MLIGDLRTPMKIRCEEYNRGLLIAARRCAILQPEVLDSLAKPTGGKENGTRIFRHHARVACESLQDT